MIVRVRSGLSKIKPSVWVLAAAVMGYLVLWSLYPHQLMASDPWIYSQRAFAIAEDMDFGENHIFSHRLGVTIPVAVSYALLGVNLISTHLWPLCSALLVMLVVWLALPTIFSRSVGLMLCLISVPLFEASVALFPDIITTAFMSLSACVLINRKAFTISKTSGWLVSMTAVTLSFIAFLAKESAYWVLPLWVVAFVWDMTCEKRLSSLYRFYLPSLLCGIVLGGCY